MNLALAPFQEFFSKFVCVQFSEPVPLCVVKDGARPQTAGEFRLTTQGPVALGQNPTIPIEVEKETGDKSMVFALVIEDCMLAPGNSGDRLSVMYRSGSVMMELSVDPTLIRSVTRVAGEGPGRVEESKIISS